MTAWALPDTLPLATWPAARVLWRVHRQVHAPVWFGPEPGDAPLSRFDAPAGEYRIAYFGESPEIAFAEALIRGARPPLLSRAVLESRMLSGLRAGRDLRLATLHGRGLVALGIGAEVAHAHPYDRCRTLAHAIWAHQDRVDGIRYRSRWDTDGLCVALFDRAGDMLDTEGPARRLRHPAVGRPLLRHYGVGLTP